MKLSLSNKEIIFNLLSKYSDNDAVIDCSEIDWAISLRKNYHIIYQEYNNFIKNVSNPSLHSQQVGKVADEIDIKKMENNNFICI